MENTILVDSETVKQTTPYSELIPTLQEAFASYHERESQMPPKAYIELPMYTGDFRSMPSYLNTESFEKAGTKWVSVYPDNTDLPSVMGVYILSDPETGFPLAVMNGTELTARRTGGVAGLATKLLSKEDSSTLGIVGAGAQSYEQVDAISSVRDIQEIYVTDQDESVLENFVDTFETEFDVIKSDIETCSQCDVLSTVTPVTEPIVHFIGESTHVNAMGADSPPKQEFSLDVIDDCILFVDDIEQSIHSGEITEAYNRGTIIEQELNTLGSFCSSNRIDYKNEKTLFDSTGLSIQDTAAAALVYDTIDVDQCETFTFV